MSDSDSDFEEGVPFEGMDEEFDILENEDELFDFVEDNDDESDFEEEKPASRKRKTPPKGEKAPAAKRAKKETGTSTRGKKAADSAAGTKTKGAAAKGGKVKELSEKEAYPVILNYINAQNKPYSATIVFENLHKEVKKPHAVRILAQLAQEGKIIEKEYGKTKIYFADQNQFPSVSKEELISMEEQMNALKEEEKALIAQSNMLKTELKNLQNALPDDQLQAAIEQFTKENEQMTAKLETLRNSGAIDKTQLESLQSNVNKYTKLWKQRRSMCIEGVKMLADGLEKKDSEIMELVGIETEEELGITLPFKK